LTTIRELELSQLEQLHQTALNTKQGYAREEGEIFEQVK